jgi:hypothetical protein
VILTRRGNVLSAGLLRRSSWRRGWGYIAIAFWRTKDLPRQVVSDGFELGPHGKLGEGAGPLAGGGGGRLSIANARTLESTPLVLREKHPPNRMVERNEFRERLGPAKASLLRSDGRRSLRATIRASSRKRPTTRPNCVPKDATAAVASPDISDFLEPVCAVPGDNLNFERPGADGQRLPARDSYLRLLRETIGLAAGTP